MNAEQAERYLLSLELFGMRFGLERMRRMMTALEHPERDFRSVHVVGTNGKSSTTRMIAAIAQAHGLRTGAYLSPHLNGSASTASTCGQRASPLRSRGRGRPRGRSTVTRRATTTSPSSKPSPPPRTPSSRCRASKSR